MYLVQGRKELAPVEQLDRVLQRDPSHNDTRLWRMILRILAGENVAAKEEAGIVLDREPLLGPVRMLYGEILRTEGDTAGAIREERRVLEHAPGNISAIRYLTLAYLDAGDVVQARSLLQEKQALFPGNYMWRQAWALLLAVEGKREEAIRMMDVETEKFAAGAFIVALENAEFYAVLGNTPKAIEWLERAVRNGDERVAWFRRNPRLASIRDDPRFARLVDSVEARKRQQ